MALNIEDNRIEVIQKIEKKIDEKIEAKEAKLIKAFLEQYYMGVSAYDLRTKSILDLYGSLVSFWHFLYQRKPGETKMRVFNPQVEQHGWQSPHTIIEIDHENKPFLLDSIRLALHKLDINIHLAIHAEGIRFKRDATGKIIEVLPLDYSNKAKKPEDRALEEAPIYIEIDRQSNVDDLLKITNSLEGVLADVDLMVKDWAAMLQRVKQTLDILEKSTSKPEQDLPEIILYLKWLTDNNFTFIGYAEYDFSTAGAGGGALQYVSNSGLGVLTQTPSRLLSRDFSKMYPDARDMYLNDEIMLLGKTDTISTVHRPAYTDFIAIKIFNADGRLQKVMRFVGLYTSIVYNDNPEDIPYVRKKIDRVLRMSKFPKNSHDGKALIHIISTLPRDELFHARDSELFDFAIGILHLQERQRIRIFMRRDIYGRYFSCLVFVPRDVFTSQLRQTIQDILVEDLHGESVTFDSKFSESILARIHYMVRVSPLEEITFDTARIEEQLVDSARSWLDELQDALVEHCGEEKTNDIIKVYGTAFPLSYREFFSARTAVNDIEHMENLCKFDDNHLEISLYKPIEDEENSFRFKLFRNNTAIPLSDIVPILERMGLRIISERPHELKLAGGRSVWINDYQMINPKGAVLDIDILRKFFQPAFDAIWHELAENDGFNRLVVIASLGWRDVSILRAYYRYLWQIGLMFSQVSVEDALANNHILTNKLIAYFYLKFDPAQQQANQAERLVNLKAEIEAGLEAIVSLNEDKILRHYLGTLVAAVRTNYFQLDAQGKFKSSCSYKFDSSKVPDLPLPKPLCEIFVYAPSVEAIHLRGDLVARGGIRWSDRHEDFRTEVLSLMKTQQVKNAVIVPLGAKGGFIVKSNLQELTTREEKNAMIIKCYQIFIRGLLDITDNYKGSEVLKPANTICWDGNDPYLVVAADKGTATFSDIANAISKDYNYWLSDAFASGGSTGYDHKKMAITARGAWESVKMHFQRLNIDVQEQSITLFGIGDMAGDVFGNGMLLSDKIKLVAAFNHMHIFIDPDPDPLVSFAERKRMFSLPTSAWSDYNSKLISSGGGIFARSAKKIPLSTQMQNLFKTTKDSMPPNELLIAILTLDVDLFFNGGIGTFVKSEIERNADVGDRANDAIRINGSQLKVKVVCEGGNLGFTQLGRIEYAKNGGIINTDAIDNSGGVNCSDNEVNIKILLNEVVSGGDMTEKQRNELLSSMTNDVAELVLANNRKQNEALTLTDFQAGANLKMHNRLLKELERTAGLDPVVEFLPNEEELALRLAAQLGFTRPEIAVLMAYTKITLKKQLLISDVPDDAYVEYVLVNYFPKALHQKQFSKYMLQHRLKRAIIATQISNSVIDEMGINFIQRLEEESGASGPEITRAYMAAREVFDAYNIRAKIRALGVNVAMELQINMLQDLNRLIRRGTRWFLRNRHGNLAIANLIVQFKPLINELQNNLDNYLRDARQDKMTNERTKLLEAGVPVELAKRVSRFNALFAGLDIVEAAIENKYPVLDVAQVYFTVGGQLKLGWFGEMINKQPVTNNWEALARAAFRDDVDRQQRNLAILIMRSSKLRPKDLEIYTNDWFACRADFTQRWEIFIGELKNTTPDFTMFAVTLRELFNLSQAVIG